MWMMMTRKIKIAAAQYPLDELKDLQAYEAKITRWVEEAVNAGAGLLVFPEYGSMELASIGGKAGEVQASFDVVSGLVPELDRVHVKLAAKHGVTIVAGSGPQRRPGCTMNVAHIFGPTGIKGHYDKIMPTPWEREPWHIASGKTLTVFDVGIARIGLLICYDIEFPLLSRALAEAGAEIILAPSNTETEWGYWRVRTGAVARALENQVYTVHSPVVGASPWSAACPANCGMAGIFAPSDVGFPPGGVLALGEMNKPQWVYAEVDLDLIAKVRASGGVQTYKHWAEQPGAGVLLKARVVDISGAKQ
jgi:predicted amidohydrolase